MEQYRFYTQITYTKREYIPMTYSPYLTRIKGGRILCTNTSEIGVCPLPDRNNEWDRDRKKGITNKALFTCLSLFLSLLLSTCHAGHPHTCLLYSLILTYRLFDLAHYNPKFSEKSSLNMKQLPKAAPE